MGKTFRNDDDDYEYNHKSRKNNKSKAKKIQKFKQIHIGDKKKQLLDELAPDKISLWEEDYE